jgi:hypothetical protein
MHLKHESIYKTMSENYSNRLIHDRLKKVASLLKPSSTTNIDSYMCVFFGGVLLVLIFFFF